MKINQNFVLSVISSLLLASCAPQATKKATVIAQPTPNSQNPSADPGKEKPDAGKNLDPKAVDNKKKKPAPGTDTPKPAPVEIKPEEKIEGDILTSSISAIASSIQCDFPYLNANSKPPVTQWGEAKLSVKTPDGTDKKYIKGSNYVFELPIHLPPVNSVQKITKLEIQFTGLRTYVAAPDSDHPVSAQVLCLPKTKICSGIKDESDTANLNPAYFGTGQLFSNTHDFSTLIAPVGYSVNGEEKALLTEAPSASLDLFAAFGIDSSNATAVAKFLKDNLETSTQAPGYFVLQVVLANNSYADAVTGVLEAQVDTSLIGAGYPTPVAAKQEDVVNPEPQPKPEPKKKEVVVTPQPQPQPKPKKKEEPVVTTPPPAPKPKKEVVVTPQPQILPAPIPPVVISPPVITVDPLTVKVAPIVLTETKISVDQLLFNPMHKNMIDFKVTDNGNKEWFNQQVNFKYGYNTKFSAEEVAQSNLDKLNSSDATYLKKYSVELGKDIATSSQNTALDPNNGVVGIFQVNYYKKSKEVLRHIRLTTRSYPLAGESATATKTRLEKFFKDSNALIPSAITDLKDLMKDFDQYIITLNGPGGNPIFKVIEVKKPSTSGGIPQTTITNQTTVKLAQPLKLKTLKANFDRVSKGGTKVYTSSGSTQTHLLMMEHPNTIGGADYAWATQRKRDLEAKLSLPTNPSLEGVRLLGAGCGGTVVASFKKAKYHGVDCYETELHYYYVNTNDLSKVHELIYTNKTTDAKTARKILERDEAVYKDLKKTAYQLPQ